MHFNIRFRPIKTRIRACSGRQGPGFEARFVGLLGNVGAMTIGAGKGSGLVEQYLLPIHFLHQAVTILAGDILMPALERELGLLVIEERRLPLVAVVARGAISFSVGELVAVRVLVALAAGLWSLAEIHVEQGALHVRRLVAIGAIHGSMRPDEREFGSRVIESVHIVPILG